MEHKASLSKSRLNSVAHALDGLRQTLIGEINMRIHMATALFVFISGLVKGLTIMQWIVLCICIGIVLAAETFNTCIEHICDLAFGTRFHPSVKKIKDMSAGAVLITAVISVVTGILIFFS